MTRCIRCGRFVGDELGFEDLAGDRLCDVCYDPDRDVDIRTLPREPDDIPGYDYPSERLL